MNDQPEQFESELSAMRPRMISKTIFDQIEAELDEPRPSRWADRLLLSAMSAGSLAACVIVGLFLSEMQSSQFAAPPMNIAAVPSSVSDSPLAFARADPAWFEAVK